ncbi:DUF512 domain-containing protein [Candidatus Palauibacter soopunensis]|uniref:DUF512 domain-containing protein n=1 Tax=Candidatus Palauibacter soopunensis TaxID=3056739 RepID=UPI0023875A97|nr:DUF512 domain-containing protein [Candidatus Palauibacter soopunensis]MDE2880152.1 DUF512 domain-containing protein [Candidatus Palauibacter soopunensis]
MIRVASVKPGSIAADLELPAGLAVLEINGKPIRDSLDLLFHQAEPALRVLAERQTGERLLFEIEKPADEPLGIVPEPDKIRRCTNACPFCFVKGNPKLDKLRAPLYVKDDDYRLSFLHGHYITLTNLRPDDWDRIFEQRLSPLYVSVHSTDPAVRLRMLKNPRSANIGQDLDRLAEGRIVVHAQVVLCPEVNDGEHLTGTIEDLYRRGEAIRSLSIVPVGLTSWNAALGGRTLEPAECRAALEAVDAIRERALPERGQGWCYAADELYLQAGLEPPGAGYFDDHELESNGVGAISTLTDRVTGQLEALGPLEGCRVVAVTGTSMGPTMTRLAGRVARRTGAEVSTLAVENTLYGPMVTTAGLLPGADHRNALLDAGDFDVALFSAQALNDGDIFLDDVSLSELRAGFPGRRVEPSHDLVDVLSRL